MTLYQEIVIDEPAPWKKIVLRGPDLVLTAHYTERPKSGATGPITVQHALWCANKYHGSKDTTPLKAYVNGVEASPGDLVPLGAEIEIVPAISEGA